MSGVRVTGLILAAVVALSVPHGHAQVQKDKVEPPNLPNEAQVMQVKLKRAHSLLDALAKEDFKSLEENATALARISDATSFLRAYKTEEYEINARHFKRAAQTLAARAADKNLDGATLAYIDMTMSCVKCHTYFRGRKQE
jgi:cytochrome c556